MGTEKEKLQNSIYNSEKTIEWGGWLNEFLWICAGVDRKVLRQCPTDYAKYAGIGGTILFTAMMAMMSGGYALFTVFDDWRIATAFGIFWGLLIFNLDRFIVNTMYSDGNVTISWNEFVCGLPRIIMAIFLGIVISTPLELKIFEDEINVVIKERIKDRVKEYQADAVSEIKDMQNRADSIAAKREELRSSPLDIHISSLTNDQNINNLITEKNHKTADWNKEDNVIKTIESQRYALLHKRTHNDSIKANSKNNEKWQHVKNRSALAQAINTINAKLMSYSASNADLAKKAQDKRDADLLAMDKEKENIDKEIAEAKARLKDDDFGPEIMQEYGGFQARMDAFSHMKTENQSTFLSSTFIMLLFIIIETAPTFFKMMIASGPYDDLLRAEMHRVKVLSDKRVSNINDDVNTDVTISVEKNKKRLEAELLANEEIMKKIASVQAELLEEAIEKWRIEELEKVRQNPSAYIHTSSQSNAKS